MFKSYFIIGFILNNIVTFAQSDTQIYLFEISQNKDSVVLKNGTDISQNQGYNNQPSFMDDDHLFYARTQDGQTDVALYDVSNAQTKIINATKVGSEYSPKMIPNTDRVATVRLDTTGLQRLYSYSLSDTTSSKISELKIGYFDFYDSGHLFAAVLNPIAMDLYFINCQTGKDSLLLKNVGRSIHKIPDTESISYTSINEEQGLDLYILDIHTLESFFVCALPVGIEDYTWLDKSRMILGSGEKLFMYDTLMSNTWEEAADLSHLNFKHITRIAVNPVGNKIALVAEKE